MKVTVEERSVKALPFPKLMLSKHGTVILATQQDKNIIKGFVVSESEGAVYKLGQCGVGWNADAFTDFNGTVTLENS